MKKIILCCCIVFSMGVFINANACQTEKCNNNGDCSKYGNERCKTAGASCKGQWDEDPFKSGTQGCHGTCYCKEPSSTSSATTVQGSSSTKKAPSKPHHPRSQDAQKRLKSRSQ
ncbi:hypothetical protein [Legionella nagasakiensis]|uniref:hypothetical protein n=1 Tax=Legionella nagasakiensis TaxID=535290 RepID=UPI001055CB07|nr:hypothetical protein [Legionella nagasakiensis]